MIEWDSAIACLFHLAIVDFEACAPFVSPSKEDKQGTWLPELLGYFQVNQKTSFDIQQA